MMERIPILIADDHAQVRAQVLERLEREQDFEIVGVATDSSAAVRRTAETHARIVLIDPTMQDGLGLDAIRTVRERTPETVIVVLCAVVDTAQRIELEKLGVQFILNKGIESRKLVQALHDASRVTGTHPSYSSEGKLNV
jgi:DNA-binding NarL/FixJ family response regulator